MDSVRFELKARGNFSGALPISEISDVLLRPFKTEVLPIYHSYCCPTVRRIRRLNNDNSPSASTNLSVKTPINCLVSATSLPSAIPLHSRYARQFSQSHGGPDNSAKIAVRFVARFLRVAMAHDTARRPSVAQVRADLIRWGVAVGGSA